MNSQAQYTSVFTEDFESCGVGNVPLCQWNFQGSGSRWTTTAASCAITGNYSLSVGSDISFCEYNVDFGVSDIIAYRQFDATAFHDLSIEFDWKCVGEIGIDFGRVVWSPDGIAWSNVSGAQYQNQISIATDSLPLDPSLDNDPTAYIGFRWFDDATNGAFPGFVVDNINIIGEPDTPGVPTPPVSSFPTSCDSVIISFGGIPSSPNVTWYWQDTVCGTDSTISSASNYTVFNTGTYYLAAYNNLSGLWSTSCASFNATILAQPSASPGLGGVECDLNFVFSAVPSVGTGSWSMFFGPGTPTFSSTSSPTGISPTDTVTVSDYGVYLFEWTETNGQCTSTDLISVGFYGQPSSDAGVGDTSCSLTSTLKANASFGLGTWSQLSGPSGGSSIYANVNSPYTDVTVDSTGMYIFQWIEENGSCSDTDSVSFWFYNPPIADAGVSANILCDTSYTFTAVLGSGSGIWSQMLGPGPSNITDSTNPNTVVTIDEMGIYIFQWSTIDGYCTNSDTMVLSFEDPLVTDAGTGGIECDLNAVFSASKYFNTPPNISTGLWSKVSGPGLTIFTISSNPTTSVTVTKPGTYVFNWTETLGTCVDTDDVMIIFNEPIIADAGPDTNVSLGNSISLFGQGGTNYIWSPDTFLDNPNGPLPMVVDPLQTTSYQLLVTDNSGCTDIDSVTVTVDIDYNFIAANIMTPNADGYNDTWYIDNIDFYSDCEVAIYNRYGYMVYNKAGYVNDWDGSSSGTILPDGTYYYVITCPGTQEVFKGGITIMRE